MSETLTNILTKLLIAVGIAMAGYLLAWGINWLLKKILIRFLKASWANLIANLAVLVVAFVTLDLIVDMTGWAGALAMVVAAITGAFTIGSDKLASDFQAGLKLLFLDYYAVGETVTIGGHMGKVEDISLTHTVIATRKRDKVIIPNSTAVNQIVVNHSQIPGHIVSVSVPIKGKHDRRQVMDVMQETGQAFEFRMEEFPALVLLDEVGVNTSYYKVGVIVFEDNWKPSTGARLRLATVEALEAAGIEVGEAEAVKFVTKD